MAESRPMTAKQRLFFDAFTDRGAPTFMHQMKSAEAAEYAHAEKVAYKVFQSIRPHIEAWLETEGLSDHALKLKLVQLLDARETKFFAHEGAVTDQREVQALAIQRQALDMALRVKGLYAPDRLEHSGGITVSHEQALAELE